MRNNPFLENIQVTGDGYIGRHSDIRYLMNIFRNKGRDTGVVISGLTRMGKTSLVKKCFLMAEEEGLLEENKIVTACITVSALEDFSEVIKKLAEDLYDALEERELLDSFLEKKFKEIAALFDAQDAQLIYSLDRLLKQVLKRMRKNGIKAVVLLDEFDDARRAFSYKGEEVSANFQKFRDYASAAEYNITFILTSRVSISLIDTSLPAGSNLRGVFSERVLVGFTDEERDEFFAKLAECGAALSAEQKKDFIWYAGRSPFLFSKIACGILEQDESIPVEEISIRRVVESRRRDFTAYFDSLIDFMIRDNALLSFIQVFFGPVHDLTKKDTGRLESYGYIYHDTNDKGFIDAGFTDQNSADSNDVLSYQTISSYFLEYVRFDQSYENSAKIWADLITAEKELRKVIRKGLESEYGEGEWIQKLQDLARSRQKGYLYDANKAEAFIENSKKDFGEAVEDDPLSVISINALGNIICAFWAELYHEIFDPPYASKESLSEELQKLNRARNPLAHGKDDYLTQEDKNEVSVCCRKIIRKFSSDGSRKRRGAGRKQSC